MSQNAELACTYAALILHDGGVDVTAAGINALIEGAGLQDVPPFWPNLFQTVLKERSLDDIIANAGTSGGSTGGATESAAPEAEVVEEEEVVESSESSEGEMGFSFFGSESSSY
eukprot:TRINITY_DN2492_c0_g1_i2.p1 TRINITY_DN2492_c0_g1~~TRINITY_DN2492_c0_g1_i2.p1  ORF type:complete len:114 (-),score=42.82 TRINITY_DN2492_c0_g1_i2:56-397(-)